MSESGKLALFIDGANLYSTARALGFDIDFKKLLAVFAERGRLLRAFYYTPMFEDQEGSSTRPLIDWLSYNGHDVRTRSVRDFADQNGRRKARSSLSIELAVNAFEIVLRRYDETADSKDRFRHERRDLAGRRCLDQFLDVVRTCESAIVRRRVERTAVAIRSVSVNKSGNLGSYWLPVRMPDRRQCGRRSSRVTVPGDHDLVPSGRKLRGHYGSIVSLGAAV